MAIRKTPRICKSKASTTGTICWKCDNAVPSKDRTRGCEWSLDFLPVPGWEATPTQVKTLGDLHQKDSTTQTYASFHVHSCPKFHNEKQEQKKKK